MKRIVRTGISLKTSNPKCLAPFQPFDQITIKYKLTLNEDKILGKEVRECFLSDLKKLTKGQHDRPLGRVVTIYKLSFQDKLVRYLTVANKRELDQYYQKNYPTAQRSIKDNIERP